MYFELPEGTLKGAELRIFSEFGSRTHANELTYHDKAVAEVMLGFTRARRRPTPDAFWQKNHSAMKCMVDLFAETNDLLKALYADRLRLVKPATVKKVKENVMMTKLDKINIGKLQEGMKAIVPVFEKSCRYIASHSQPIEMQGIRPTLDELKADYDTVSKARQPHKE